MDRRARSRRGRRPGARAPARRQDARPGRRRTGRVRRAARVRRRELDLGARRAARRLDSSRSPIRRSATSAASQLRQRGRRLAGGRLLALRDEGARARVRARGCDRRQRRDLRGTRRESYVEVDPRMGHDLSFPFNMVARGWRALYQPAARATEKMVPTNEGEFHRKRRMMSHAWPIVIRGRAARRHEVSRPALFPRAVNSHRVLRYGSPFLHIALLLANLGLARPRAGDLPALRWRPRLAFFAAAAGGRRRSPARGGCSSSRATTCS